MNYSIDLSQRQETWVHHEKFQVYALENLPYCTNPANPELQRLSIFVPEAYIKNGVIDYRVQIGKYTAATAPIIYENNVAGYAEACPRMLSERMFKEAAPFLAAGMIYVNAGSRGRQSHSDGRFTGKAPAGLVDLKSGIRYLRKNRAVLPGNMDRIITIGVSAGGAMSSLLGTTGDNTHYEEYLRECGAAMDESDHVYASQCYCPITDLDYADSGYEWMFGAADWMDPFQKALSQLLRIKYVHYFNSLNVVDPDGKPLRFNKENAHSGSAYDYLMNLLNRSATKHLNMLKEGKLPVNYSATDYLTGNYCYFGHKKPAPGTMPPSPGGSGGPGGPHLIELPGIDKRSWLSWDGKTASITSLDAMYGTYLTRMKACPAFDDKDLRQPENQEFGNDHIDRLHFNPAIAPILEQLQNEFPEEYFKYHSEYAKVDRNAELSRQKYLLNPLNFISTAERCHCAEHFRIRVGSRDAHTSFMVSMLLALKLTAAAVDVDYAIVWDEDHGRCDYEGELCAWVESIC